ncbi:hypothetical protein BDQ17DRAFT_1345782, partial [Cyathus striatus]
VVVSKIDVLSDLGVVGDCGSISTALPLELSLAYWATQRPNFDFSLGKYEFRETLTLLVPKS